MRELFDICPLRIHGEDLTGLDERDAPVLAGESGVSRYGEQQKCTEQQ